MQASKNDTDNKKFANLATENYGRKYYQHLSNESLFHGFLSFSIALQKLKIAYKYDIVVF